MRWSSTHCFRPTNVPVSELPQGAYYIVSLNGLVLFKNVREVVGCAFWQVRTVPRSTAAPPAQAKTGETSKQVIDDERKYVMGMVLLG